MAAPKGAAVISLAIAMMRRSLSEAYFGESDTFPFTRDDLKEFDPDSYRVIAEAWERPFKATSQRFLVIGPWNPDRQ